MLTWTKFQLYLLAEILVYTFNGYIQKTLIIRDHEKNILFFIKGKD